MYPEHICVPVAAWHTMHSKRESRFCISCSFTLWWRWQYIQQHWLAAAKQLIVNLYCHQQQLTLLAHTPECLMIFSSILSQTPTTTPQPFFGPFSGTTWGEPVPEENFWTLWLKGRLSEADTLTIRLGTTPSGLTSAHLHHPPIFFYGPDALAADQPTVSKHWRQLLSQTNE